MVSYSNNYTTCHCQPVVFSDVNKANSVKAKAKASHSKSMVKASHFKDKIKVVYLNKMA